MNNLKFGEIALKFRRIPCLVDGILFELNEELIQKRIPNSIFARQDRLSQFYDKEKHIYIFDQPNDAFEILVYFISTGLLSRPTHVDNIKLYLLLEFFEIDEIILNTYKKMEHLAFENNRERTKWFVEDIISNVLY